MREKYIAATEISLAAQVKLRGYSLVCLIFARLHSLQDLGLRVRHYHFPHPRGSTDMRLLTDLFLCSPHESIPHAARNTAILLLLLQQLRGIQDMFSSSSVTAYAIVLDGTLDARTININWVWFQCFNMFHILKKTICSP